ncbi:MAG: hypothetical protein WCJ84_01530 [Candidatus Peregrinibacteria bacterium]
MPVIARREATRQSTLPHHTKLDHFVVPLLVMTGHSLIEREIF